MHLLELSCREFRCLESVKFSPQPGLNIICGNNAQGKTSLLEALFFAVTTKSQRTNAEETLLRHGAEGFQLRVDVQRRDRRVAIEAKWSQGVKRFKVNGVAQARLSDVLGKASVVLFSPEDISLIKGGAALRRQFLDMELSQLSPSYLTALQGYRKVLRQRNEVLRDREKASETLEVWDVQLERYGTILMRERAAFLEALAVKAQDAYGAMSNGESFGLSYAPDVPEGRTMGEVLQAARGTDLQRGITSRGPHRDEVQLRIGGDSARTHGSQGQQKSAALSLKLALVGIVHERSEEYPILMLDEVLSELDQDRARRLFDAIPDGVQCVVTTTDLRAKEWEVCGGAKIFQMEEGRLREL